MAMDLQTPSTEQDLQAYLWHSNKGKLTYASASCSPRFLNKPLILCGRAIENKNTCCSQVMEPGASNNPPDPH
eukprot:1137407-Pelagomonas_calceolata.AAC.1